VLRDLEHLMNARNPFFDVAAEFPEVARSVISYGLPDISSLYLTRTKDQQDLRQAVENAIATFEPRLDKVKVTAIPMETGEISIDGQKSDRRIVAAMRFRVDAVLLIDPSPEAIAFDIDMSVETRNCQVKGLP
jgi:type VI secretion system protein ImpF